MSGLSGIRALLVDIEGTLHFKGRAIPGAAEAVMRLRRMGVPLRFLTNADSTTTAMVARELSGLGIPAAAEEILSPACVALDLVRRRGGGRCYTLLSPELASDFTPYATRAGERADWVVVGDVRQCCTYEALDQAFRHLINGAELLALQAGRFFVRPDGYHLDTGAFVRMLEHASGKAALVVGKPSPDLFRLALEQLGVTPSETAVVGDDVTTDIAGARLLGARAVLVRTGKFGSSVPPGAGAEPDLTIDSFAEIPEFMGGES